MPIINFHVVEGQYSDAQQESLLTEGSCVFARVLGAPVERVRAFLSFYPTQNLAVGGQLVRDSQILSPYFQCTILAGRSVQQRHQLLSEITTVVERALQADRELIRGSIVQIDPDNWAIAGVPASTARAAEVLARSNP